MCYVLVHALSSDATMKYTYRAMSLGQNCTKLLQWHEKLYEKVRPHSHTHTHIHAAWRHLFRWLFRCSRGPAVTGERASRVLCRDGCCATERAKVESAWCSPAALLALLCFSACGSRMAPVSSCARSWTARSTAKQPAAERRSGRSFPAPAPHCFRSLLYF